MYTNTSEFTPYSSVFSPSGIINGTSFQDQYHSKITIRTSLSENQAKWEKNRNMHQTDNRFDLYITGFFLLENQVFFIETTSP